MSMGVDALESRHGSNEVSPVMSAYELFRQEAALAEDDKNLVRSARRKLSVPETLDINDPDWSCNE